MDKTAYVTEKFGVFVRFRAPLHLTTALDEFFISEGI
jgi:hypothetical protein